MQSLSSKQRKNGESSAMFLPASQVAKTTPQYTILVIGSSKESQTEYVTRCLYQTQPDCPLSTLTQDTRSESVKFNEQRIALTVSHFPNRRNSDLPYRAVNAIIIACDLNNADSIKDIKQWHQQIFEHQDTNIALNIIGTISRNANGQYPQENLLLMTSIAQELDAPPFVIDLAQVVPETPIRNLIEQLENEQPRGQSLQTLQQRTAADNQPPMPHPM